MANNPMNIKGFLDAKKEGSAILLAIALSAISAIVVMNIGQVAVTVTKSAAEGGVQKGKDLFRARELMEIASYEIKQGSAIPAAWVDIADFFTQSDVVDGFTNSELIASCMRPLGVWTDSSGSWQLEPDNAREIQSFRRYRLTGLSVLPMDGVGAVVAGSMVDVSNSLAANGLDVTSVVACAAPKPNSLRRVQSNLINFRGVMRTAEIREI